MTLGERQFQEQLLAELRRIAGALEVISSAVYPKSEMSPPRVGVQQVSSSKGTRGPG